MYFSAGMLSGTNTLAGGYNYGILANFSVGMSFLYYTMSIEYE